MLLIGQPTGRLKSKTLVWVGRKPRSKYITVFCQGPRSHYDKAGRCAHTDAIVANLRPDIDKAFVRVWPFGDNDNGTIPCQARET
jgi:hypothetical protein